MFWTQSELKKNRVALYNFNQEIMIKECNNKMIWVQNRLDKKEITKKFKMWKIILKIIMIKWEFNMIRIKKFKKEIMNNI